MSAQGPTTSKKIIKALKSEKEPNKKFQLFSQLIATEQANLADGEDIGPILQKAFKSLKAKDVEGILEGMVTTLLPGVEKKPEAFKNDTENQTLIINGLLSPDQKNEFDADQLARGMMALIDLKPEQKHEKYNDLIGVFYDSLGKVKSNIAKHNAAIDELPATEANYIQQLEAFVKAFDENPATELKSAIEAIRESIRVHKEFLAVLNEELENHTFPSDNLNRALETVFEADSKAISRYQDAQDFVPKLLATNEDLQQLQDSLPGDKATILDMMAPVAQRALKYPLLIEQIIKENKNDLITENLTALQSHTKKLAERLNALQTQKELNQAENQVKNLTKTLKKSFLKSETRKRKKRLLTQAQLIVTSSSASLKLNELKSDPQLSNATKKTENELKSDLRSHIGLFLETQKQTMGNINPRKITKESDVQKQLDAVNSLLTGIARKQEWLQKFSSNVPDEVAMLSDRLYESRLKTLQLQDQLTIKQTNLQKKDQKAPEQRDTEITLNKDLVKLLHSRLKEYQEKEDALKNLPDTIRPPLIDEYRKTFKKSIQGDLETYLSKFIKAIADKQNAIPQRSLKESNRGKKIEKDLNKIDSMIKDLNSVKDLEEPTLEPAQLDAIEKQINSLKSKQMDLLLLDIERLQQKTKAHKKFGQTLQDTVTALKAKRSELAPDDYLDLLNSARTTLNKLQASSKSKNKEGAPSSSTQPNNPPGTQPIPTPQTTSAPSVVVPSVIVPSVVVPPTAAPNQSSRTQQETNSSSQRQGGVFTTNLSQQPKVVVVAVDWDSAVQNILLHERERKNEDLRENGDLTIRSDQEGIMTVSFKDEEYTISKSSRENEVYIQNSNGSKQPSILNINIITDMLTDKPLKGPTVERNSNPKPK